MPKTHSTTILTVRHQGVVAIGGDGQVTVGNTVMKADAVKIRRLNEQKVITGFAGAGADAFALLERFEAKLKDYPANVPRGHGVGQGVADRPGPAAAGGHDGCRRRPLYAPAYRQRRRNSADRRRVGHRSGGSYAVAAARALLKHSSLSAAEIVREALTIAAGIDIYTNTNILVEELPCETGQS